MDKARATAAPTAVAQPQMIPPRTPVGPSAIQAKPSPLAVSVPAGKARNSVLSPDVFSSSVVTENGSYEFDRVLKSGYVRKRTRKTKVSEHELLGPGPLLLTIS